MIEYNWVDGEKFRKKVGEGWWRKLDDLAERLNKASELVGRKSVDIALGTHTATVSFQSQLAR